MLENVVYFELLRRGYDVAIGKIGSLEVDFIATTTNEKIVLSIDTGLDTSYDGIKSVNLIDWLLSE